MQNILKFGRNLLELIGEILGFIWGLFGVLDSIRRETFPDPISITLLVIGVCAVIAIIFSRHSVLFFLRAALNSIISPFSKSSKYNQIDNKFAKKFNKKFSRVKDHIAKLERLEQWVNEITYSSEHLDDPLRIDLARAHEKLGASFNEHNRTPQAIQHLETALKIRENLENASNNQLWHELACCHEKIGELLEKENKEQRALEHLKTGLEIRLEYLANTTYDRWQNALIDCYEKIGELLEMHNDNLNALKHRGAALFLRDCMASSALKPNPSSVQQQLNIALRHHNFGEKYAEYKEHSEALKHFEAELAIRKRHIPDPENIQMWERLADCHHSCASGYENKQDEHKKIKYTVKAWTHYEEELKIREHDLPSLSEDRLRYKMAYCRDCLYTLFERLIAELQNEMDVHYLLARSIRSRVDEC